MGLEVILGSAFYEGSMPPLPKKSKRSKRRKWLLLMTSTLGFTIRVKRILWRLTNPVNFFAHSDWFQETFTTQKFSKFSCLFIKDFVKMKQLNYHQTLIFNSPSSILDNDKSYRPLIINTISAQMNMLIQDRISGQTLRSLPTMLTIVEVNQASLALNYLHYN